MKATSVAVPETPVTAIIAFNFLLLPENKNGNDCINSTESGYSREKVSYLVLSVPDGG